MVIELRGYYFDTRTLMRLRFKLGKVLGLTKTRVIWMGGRAFFLTSGSEDIDSDLDRAHEEGRITADGDEVVYSTDMIVRALRMSDGATVYVAVEASGVIGVRDIDRARESANVLAELYAATAIPAVYGFDIAREQAEQAKPDPDAGLQEVHIFIETERF